MVGVNIYLNANVLLHPFSLANIYLLACLDGGVMD
jgi:hypothetical protein